MSHPLCWAMFGWMLGVRSATNQIRLVMTGFFVVRVHGYLTGDCLSFIPVVNGSSCRTIVVGPPVLFSGWWWWWGCVWRNRIDAAGMRPLTCLSGEGAGLPTLASILPLPHSPSHLHQRGLLITRPNQTSSRRFREVVFNGGLRRRWWSIQTLGADTGSPRSVPPFCTFWFVDDFCLF